MIRKTLQLVLVMALSGASALAQQPPLTAKRDSGDIVQKLDELSRQNAVLQQKVEALEKQNGQQNGPKERQRTTPAAGAVTVAGVQIKPYGYIKFDAVYDSARTAYGDLAFWTLPAGSAGGDEAELTFSARETRMGLNFSGPEGERVRLSGRVEADLYEDAATANKYSPRLRLAYVDIAWGKGWSLRFGQDWDTYINFHPTTVDATILGNQGHAYGRHPQVRLTKDIKVSDKTAVAIKLALQHGRNGGNLDGDNQPDENAAATPTIMGSLAVKSKISGRDGIFSISGGYGREKVRGTLNPGTYDSWLIHGGLQLPIGSRFTLQGIGWAGENLDNYLAGIGQGVNLAAGTEVASHGGWVQGVVTLGKSVKTGVGYGLDDPDNEDLGGDARTINDRVFANLFYSLTGRTTIGLEYSLLRTDYALTENTRDHRVQCSVKYDF